MTEAGRRRVIKGGGKRRRRGVVTTRWGRTCLPASKLKSLKCGQVRIHQIGPGWPAFGEDEVMGEESVWSRKRRGLRV